MKTLIKKELFGRQIMGACCVQLLKSEKTNLYYIIVRQGTGGYGFHFKSKEDAEKRFSLECMNSEKTYGGYVSISGMTCLITSNNKKG